MDKDKDKASARIGTKNKCKTSVWQGQGQEKVEFRGTVLCKMGACRMENAAVWKNLVLA